VIADYTGAFDNPEELAARLSSTVGVLEHGLFPPSMVSDVVVARGERVDRIEITPARDSLSHWPSFNTD
jgi:ribose 5-phosphate isomerase A